MSLDSLSTLFLNELKDVYNAEKQILTALPRMAKAAESPELAEAFTKHRKETEGHVARIEKIFQQLDQPARGRSARVWKDCSRKGRKSWKRMAKEA